jgi:hypothetical protein
LLNTVGTSHLCQSLPKWVARVTSAYATMAAVLRIRASQRNAFRSHRVDWRIVAGRLLAVGA